MHQHIMYHRLSDGKWICWHCKKEKPVPTPGDYYFSPIDSEVFYIEKTNAKSNS